ncbi:MAG: AI-2E family transporter [Candidatus Nomurabacteria bacterium]|jgi:predicted PurR-regulated permease PerM|nr:AI-2E family transporter [Candidatus Nomurabacteria bacterium]
MSRSIQVDTKTFVRFWLVILGLGVAALFIWKAGVGLLILGISLFLAIAISPLVHKLVGIIPGGAKRKLPTTLAYILVVGVLMAIIAVVVPSIVNETVKFVGSLPNTIGDVTKGLNGINEFGAAFGIENFQDQIMKSVEGFSTAFVADFGSNLLNSVGAIGNFFAATILILVLTFLMLMEGPSMMKGFWKNFEQNKRAPKIEKVLNRMADVVAKYVTGALTVALINGCATTLIVFVMSLIFGFSAGLALPFGLITGVMCLIPMFGSFIGGTLVALLLAFNSWWAGLAFFIYIIVYLQIEANFISPKIQSKGMQLPALIVLGAVTVGVYMFGLIGAIVAIPIAGCVKVLIEEYGSRDKDEQTDETKLIAK